MYLSSNDQSLVNDSGHDHISFSKLLRKFKPVYDLYMWDEQELCIHRKITWPNGEPKGRKRNMTACGCLGFILMWYRTRGSCARGLAMLFGQTSTLMYNWLKFGRAVLLHVLSRDPDAMVSMPTDNDVYFFQEVIGAKYPVFHEV